MTELFIVQAAQLSWQSVWKSESDREVALPEKPLLQLAEICLAGL